MARSSKKRKSIQPRKRQNPFWQSFIRRRLIPLSLFFALAITTTWFFTTGVYDRVKEKTWASFIEKSVTHGFVIKDVQVTGRNRVSKEILIGLLNMKAGDPIFTFDPTEAKKNIEQLSWVHSAQIERRLPDALLINIKEREPSALWQHNKKLVVIDFDGIVLTDKNIGRFNHLPLLVGATANKHALDILPLLYAEKEVIDNTQAITRIGDRRWDLTLKNKAIVKLPEKDVGLALSRLAQLERDEGIFKKDLSIIDLRLEDKVVIRPSAKANLTIERPEFNDEKTTHKKNI